MKNSRKLLLSCFITGISIAYSQTQSSFITTWNTEFGGDSASTEIVLPITGGAYDVDFNNDGDFDDALDKENLTGIQTINLGSAGMHTIAVRPNPTANASNQLRINFGSLANDKAQKLTSINKWGSIVWTSMESAFKNCINMVIANSAGAPNLTMVTNTAAMFSFPLGSNSIFNGNISSWDVSNVTDMHNMFYYASDFSSDLSTWNVSAVTNMSSTFYEANDFNSDLSTWDVSAVTNISGMFVGTRNFDSDLSGWNVSNITHMQRVFERAVSFTSDLKDWDVSQVITMAGMFNGASSFTSNLSTWDVSNVSNMRGMLTRATGFRAEDYDALLSGWSSLSVQFGILFGAPPVTYCAGKAGREILTGTYRWRITGDTDGGCSTTSVDEEFLSNTKIYPSPTRGKINIESSFSIDKIELYNVLGAKIFSVYKTNALDLTNLRQGIYILKAFSGDRVFAKKIIKN